MRNSLVGIWYLCLLLFPIDIVIGQEVQATLPVLYEKSDVIVLGKIVFKRCIGEHLAESCGFAVKIDSIFKGTPETIYHPVIQGMDYDSSYIYKEVNGLESLEVLSFSQECNLSGISPCPEMGEYYLLFLRQGLFVDKPVAYSLVNNMSAIKPSQPLLSDLTKIAEGQNK